ncbi:hypothetical protein GDO81_002750 [Engystomops pustulosus]|uniref:Uncharacterized protein n=1 Tax=Engystomops pustulosus TaxID=76066 RepID=A0AAV7DQB9_ENGPU|nr:hypothetical protein GDO81_002750 [Engystomops pustulosus]
MFPPPTRTCAFLQLHHNITTYYPISMKLHSSLYHYKLPPIQSLLHYRITCTCLPHNYLYAPSLPYYLIHVHAFA